MHIFNRTRTMHPGRTSEAIAAAGELAACATDVAGSTVSVWSGALGFPTNSTLGWSCRIDSIAELDSMLDRLARDERYQELSARSAELFVDAPQDDVLEVIATTNVSDPQPYNCLAFARVANGQLTAAMEWGVELSQYVGAMLDRPCIFGRLPFGETGRIGWTLGLDNAGDVDAAIEKLGADAGYGERLDSAAELLREGFGRFQLVRRLS